MRPTRRPLFPGNTSQPGASFHPGALICKRLFAPTWPSHKTPQGVSLSQPGVPWLVPGNLRSLASAILNAESVPLVGMRSTRWCEDFPGSEWKSYRLPLSSRSRPGVRRHVVEPQALTVKRLRRISTREARSRPDSLVPVRKAGPHCPPRQVVLTDALNGHQRFFNSPASRIKDVVSPDERLWPVPRYLKPDRRPQ